MKFLFSRVRARQTLLYKILLTYYSLSLAFVIRQKSSHGSLPTFLWHNSIYIVHPRERIGSMEWWQWVKGDTTFQQHRKQHSWLFKAYPLLSTFFFTSAPHSKNSLVLGWANINFCLSCWEPSSCLRVATYFKRLRKRGQKFNCRLISGGSMESDVWRRVSGSGNSVSTVMV